MLSLEQHAQTGTRWFEQLSPRIRRVVVASVTTFIALVLVFVVARWYHRSQPGYVLAVLDGINSREDAQREDEYLTVEGKGIVLWLLDKRGDKPASGEKAVYAEPAINGNQCEIRTQQGNGFYTIRLVKTDHWRFDDMYVDKIGDQSIGLWVSYMKDHPYASWWSIHGDQMVGAFCDGVIIGAKLAK